MGGARAARARLLVGQDVPDAVAREDQELVARLQRQAAYLRARRASAPAARGGQRAPAVALQAHLCWRHRPGLQLKAGSAGQLSHNRHANLRHRRRQWGPGTA